MKHFLKSIRFQVFLICILCMTIMQVILFTSYYQEKQLLVSENSKRHKELINQINSSVTENCEQLNNIAMRIAYSDMVQNYLKNTDKDYRMEQREELYGFLKSYVGLKNGIKDIALLDEEGAIINVYGYSGGVRQIAAGIPNDSKNKGFFYTGLMDIRYTTAQNSLTKCLGVGINIYSTYDFNKTDRVGVLLVLFHPRSVFGFMSNVEKSQVPDMIIYDRNEQIIYSTADEEFQEHFLVNSVSDEESQEKKEVVGRMYYIQQGKMDMLGGRIVFIMSQEELMAGIDRYQRIMIILCIVSALIMLGISALCVRNIVKPMYQFMAYMKEMEGGNLKLLKKTVSLNGVQEMETMAEHFNRMMVQINELTKRLVDTSSRLYEIKIEKQQAELEYMYSQINPHFLFNTLESIKGCAVDEEAKKTFQMTNCLGNMFRYCVRGGSMVYFREEQKVIESYMYLQKCRFSDRLTFYSQVQEEIENAYIPKMILQPLLENSVVHGIEENSAVEVVLKGWIAKNEIIFVVSDNGKGISKEKREELEKALEDNSISAHIGMSNVHQRLRKIYGPSYGLKIGKKEQGFMVTLNIPYGTEFSQKVMEDEADVSDIIGR